MLDELKFRSVFVWNLLKLLVDFWVLSPIFAQSICFWSVFKCKDFFDVYSCFPGIFVLEESLPVKTIWLDEIDCGLFGAGEVTNFDIFLMSCILREGLIFNADLEQLSETFLFLIYSASKIIWKGLSRIISPSRDYVLIEDCLNFPSVDSIEIDNLFSYKAFKSILRYFAFEFLCISKICLIWFLSTSTIF